MQKINLEQTFARFTEHWSPKLIGELNNFSVKVVKAQGPFIWHHHEVEDELFLVIKGRLHMHVREASSGQRDISVGEGELIVIPHGVEHCPIADEETYLLLLEPTTTINTGQVTNERTVSQIERL